MEEENIVSVTEVKEEEPVIEVAQNENTLEKIEKESEIGR